MKIVNYILLSTLILLSLATGMTKIIQMPEEMALFSNAGFSDSLTILFGVIQVVGGFGLVLNRTRKTGAMIMGLTFTIATIVVFVNQMILFGWFSVLFIALALYFVFRPQLSQ